MSASTFPTRVVRARQTLYATLRRHFSALGYDEVETPALVPSPGMEPHITAFEVAFVPETDIGQPRTLYLHTSPEYAMKRLLAQGAGPIFQICRTYRNGEISPTHNPEFTMLEFYRPHADYGVIMAELEGALAACAAALQPSGLFARVPYERVSVRDAVLRTTGIDLRTHADGPGLARAARAIGVHVGDASSFDDVFFHLFLQKVERTLGSERPCFLVDYPVSMAALARVKADDATVAERFELYAAGSELANGYSELTDAHEQRRRLEEEQALRRSLGRPVYPLDEPFLAAVANMPPAGGVAVGLDRILMGLIGAERIDDVLLFPANRFF